MKERKLLEQNQEFLFQKVSDVLADYSSLTLAYIFGSIMKGPLYQPRSDFDIAVFFKSADYSLETILEINSRLENVMKMKLDLLILNDCSIRTRFEVIKECRLIKCLDNDFRIDFEQQTMAQYYDRRYYDLQATRKQIRGWLQNGLQ